MIVVAILLISSGGDDNKGDSSTAANSTTTTSSSGGSSQPTKPIEATVDRLLELSSVVGHPVYWAGARPGRSTS